MTRPLHYGIYEALLDRELLHWESQSNTARDSETGLNLRKHAERGYKILIFARDRKKRNGCTAPFTYLGSAHRVSDEGERPIKDQGERPINSVAPQPPMPVEMFENNRRGG